MTSSSNLINKNERLFRRLALLTVISVYLIVVAGGVVRSTGSGMGCPDWPRCFGSWVPPTDASQLPPNYAEIYGAKLKGEVVFNAAKTWIEYVNRLVGAVSGLLVLATFLLSIRYFRKDRPVFVGSLAALLLIGFNAWLGSKVVSSELAPYMVTLHMLLAIVVIFALLYVMVRSNAPAYVVSLADGAKRSINRTLLWSIGLLTVQVVLGTQVREAMDEVMTAMGEAGRMYWIERLGLPFYVHRSFSLLVLGFHVALLYQLYQRGRQNTNLYRWTLALFVMILLEIASGIILAYLGVPAFAQPIHLTLALVALGVQFIILLMVNARTFLKTEQPSALSYAH